MRKFRKNRKQNNSYHLENNEILHTNSKREFSNKPNTEVEVNSD